MPLLTSPRAYKRALNGEDSFGDLERDNLPAPLVEAENFGHKLGPAFLIRLCLVLSVHGAPGRTRGLPGGPSRVPWSEGGLSNAAASSRVFWGRKNCSSPPVPRALPPFTKWTNKMAATSRPVTGGARPTTRSALRMRNVEFGAESSKTYNDETTN